MSFWLNDIARINQQNNFTESELAKKTNKWQGYRLYIYYFWRNKRIAKIQLIEDRRSAAIVSSDEDSSSSSSHLVISIASSIYSELSIIAEPPPPNDNTDELPFLSAS